MHHVQFYSGGHFSERAEATQQYGKMNNLKCGTTCVGIGFRNEALVPICAVANQFLQRSVLLPDTVSSKP